MMPTPRPSRKTRLLLVNDHLGWENQIHGVARLFRLWALHFDPAEYDVTICILRKKNRLSRPFEERGIKIVFLGKSRYDPSTFLALLRLVRRRQIDILHVQAYGGTTFGRLVGKVTGKPVVVHFHDTTSYYPLSQKLSDRLLGGFTDAYIAVSKSVRDCWAHRCGIDPKRIKVMYNCTSIAEFQSPDAGRVAAQKIALGIPAGDRVIGTVTRLFEEKGTRYLLYAAAIVLGSIPAATFVVVGDGPMRAELQELSCRLGIQAKVKFTGYTEDVASILSTFDIMVLTSHAAEGGSPLPVIESMAMGRTVIVTDVVEIIENGRTGIVIPPRDPALLADAITFLLGNPSEAHRLGCNARKAAQVYDAARYVQNLGRIYSSLLARNEGK